MIHGDIDLTENLDFYKDRKEKKYKNTRDLSNKSTDDTSDDVIIWTSEPELMSSNRFTYHNIINNTMRSTINNTYWVNDYYLTYNNISGTWDFDNIMSSDNTLTLSVPSSPNITYNISTTDGDITSLSMSYMPTIKESNPCTKLFGKKPVKEYSNYSVIKKFSNKPKKEYKNSKIFKSVRLSRLYDSITDRYNTLHNLISGISSDIDYIFGNKHDPYPDDYQYSSIPWLEDFAKRHHSLYEDYMEELKGHNVDNDKYLTDYGWLRIH